jgi:DNA-binding transcriptional regulator YdaS (Cro superfamily)
MHTKASLIAFFGSAGALAKAADVSKQAVSQWSDDAPIPAARCRAIERASKGRITVHDLRPDFFGPAPGVAPAIPSKDRAA